MAPKLEEELKSLGEIKTELSDLGTDVKAVLTTQEQLEKDIKDGKESSDNLTVKVEDQGKTLNDIERRMNKTRFGPQGTDNLLAALPERMKVCPSLWERAGLKPERAIRNAVTEAWFKNAIQVNNPSNVRIAPDLMKEMDSIEEAFGMDASIKAITKAALAEGTGGVGGFLVPTPLEAEVLREIEDAAIVRNLARRIAMTAVTHNIPNLANGVTINLVAEAGTISDSLPATPFGQSALTAKMFAGLATLSMQLVADNAVGLMSFLVTLFGEKTGLLEDTQALEGDGAGINFTGLTAVAGTNEVLASTPGTAELPSYAKLVETKWKGRKRGTRRGAAWVMPPEHMSNIEQLVDSQGQPIFKADIAGTRTSFAPAVGGAVPDGILLGFPAYAHSELSITLSEGGQTDVGHIYFGPFGHGMIFGDLLGVQFGTSEHVNWTTGQLSMRMLKRTAILVGIPSDFTILKEMEVVD
jgi:HK97 family phage major capsid protein